MKLSTILTTIHSDKEMLKGNKVLLGWAQSLETNNCQSPDFKSPIGPTKFFERHYNWVVVRLFGCLFATLVITTSSHSPDQTR